MKEIRVGSLEDFFASVTETAREIDQGKTVTPKYTTWVEPQDLACLLQPTLKAIRQHKRVYFSVLSRELHKNARSLKKDLDILSKYELISIHSEINAKHRRERVIESNFQSEQLEFRALV